MHTYEDIIYEKRDHRAIVTINRPDVRNALRSQTYRELTDAVWTAADDGEIGVIVVTGQGTKAFSSGGDVRDQRDRGPEVGWTHLRNGLDLLRAFRGCGKPTIAAVKGFCIGGGHELHLMCDITLSADNGVFGQVGPRVGMCPVLGATQMLVHVVGEKRAREMVYTTDFIAADEAHRIGLVNHVYPLDEFDERVDAFCDRILDMSPQSLRLAKNSMNLALEDTITAVERDIRTLAGFYGSEEQREGGRAFLEKRQPDFRKFRVAAGTDRGSRSND